MREGTAFREKYKHYKGKSKYFKGENDKKVKKIKVRNIRGSILEIVKKL